MKKFLIILALFLFSCSGASAGIQVSNWLPDSDWELKSEFITPLIPDANSEDLGRVVYRTYERKSPRAVLEIILTEGSGTGSLYVPDGVKTSKGLMPASEYEILEVGSCRAILESPESLPSALALQAGENSVINIESSSLSREELISVAEKIVKNINYQND